MGRPIIKCEFEYNKQVKTCVVRNEQIGGLTLGMINSKFIPLTVSCANDEEAYLLKKNLPSLPIVDISTQNLDLKEVDLFAYSLNQQNWQFEFPVLKELLLNLNFPNFFVAINATSLNPVAELQSEYKNIGKILSDRKYYVDISRKFYRAHGGSAYKTNTFIIATQHPNIRPKMKRRRDSLGSPATIDYLKTLKVRNGYPEDWKLDVLNDKASFTDQIKKMEKCVLPTLVKMMADTIIIME